MQLFTSSLVCESKKIIFDEDIPLVLSSPKKITAGNVRRTDIRSYKKKKGQQVQRD